MSPRRFLFGQEPAAAPTAQQSKLRAYRASRRDEDLLFRPCRVTNKVVVPAIPQ